MHKHVFYHLLSVIQGQYSKLQQQDNSRDRLHLVLHL